MSRRRKRKKKMKKGLPLIVVVVIVFVVCVGIRSASLKKQSGELTKKQEILESQIKEEEQRTKDLEALEKYMEDIAKNKLGLVYPDEILIEPGNK